MGAQGNSLPRKKFYRARAHCNPLSDSQFPVPLRPEEYNWEAHYPEFFAKAAAAAAAPAEDAVVGTDHMCSPPHAPPVHCRLLR